MIYGYVRISSHQQNDESQKNVISRYCMDHKLLIDEWVLVTISSKKSLRLRMILDLIDKMKPGDILVTTELSRLGRSVKEVLSIVEKIVQTNQCRLIIVKQNLDVDPNNSHDIGTKIMITILSMMAELERDFISERTKEGLLARKAKGIKLGKPVGTVQSSMYDKDKERIFHLHTLGVPIKTIIKTHLGYGKYLSLSFYIKKRLSAFKEGGSENSLSKVS